MWTADIGADYGDVRPLDKDRIRALDKGCFHLVDRLEADVAFVTQLANAGCITWPQREHLMKIVQPRECNIKLLEFLTRRSVADFNKFRNVLIRGHQGHLVPLLETNGGETFLTDNRQVFCKALLNLRAHARRLYTFSVHSPHTNVSTIRGCSDVFHAPTRRRANVGVGPLLYAPCGGLLGFHYRLLAQWTSA